MVLLTLVKLAIEVLYLTKEKLYHNNSHNSVIINSLIIMVINLY